MGMQTTCNAMMQCSMGMAPANLLVLPINFDITVSMPAATMMDHLPFLNVLPFGMCSSLMNPMVLVATIAAFGVLTPMPCLPLTLSPWVPGSPTCQVSNKPSLNHSSVLNCLWQGVIQIGYPGEVTTMIP